ncbi:hypothetical protein Bca4012_103513 [Brassica carinata]
MVHGKVAEKSRKSHGDSPAIGPQPKHHRAAPSTRTLPTPIRTPTLLVGTEDPRGLYISTHINALALSVDYPWVILAPRTVVGDFGLEDCRRCAYQRVDPSVDCRVILAHEDCPSMRISTRWPFRGLSVGDFSPRGLSWVILLSSYRGRGLRGLSG